MVLFIFSGIYTISSVILYICWAYQHVLHISNAEDYFGFLSLFVVTTAVSAICIFVSKKEEMFILPSWCFGFANAGVILLIVYKYVFVQKSWFFGLLQEN
jgi:hypothetical protein